MNPMQESVSDAIETPRRPATSTYHGIEVTEDYRWLEEDTEETREWTAQQDARARAHLGSLPDRESVGARVAQLLRGAAVEYVDLRRCGDGYAALKSQPPLQQPLIVVLDDLGRPGEPAVERVLVDPNALDETGATTIDWYHPSPDGSLLAVSLSEHGTERGTLHVLDAATGELVQPPDPGVNSGTAGGSLAWRGDSRAYWCTRNPAPGERPAADRDFYQTVWFHEIGSDPAEDRCELAGGFADDRIAEHFLTASADGRWVLDAVQKGDGGEWQLFLRSQEADQDWRRIADLDDKCVQASFGRDALYLLSHRGAPRGQVLRLPLHPGATLADAEVVVPQSEVSIEIIAATDARLWIADIDGGPSRLRVFGAVDGTGVPTSEVPTSELPPLELPSVCCVEPLSALGADQVAWAVETFTSPRQWWVQADDDPAPRRTGLDTPPTADFSGIEVERVFATSADGTRVPMTVLSRRGTPRDGSAPALLYGYGGYGISLKPWFEAARLAWLDSGSYVVANIRGGGEYGEQWHHAGRLLDKQNCFDDFIACADHLVATGVTSRERLAVLGGSNGGLLIGAVITQRPDLAAAAVAAVPVMDALRSELTPNGAFNTTEFGSVEDPEMFRALLAYSPYHNVRDGAGYPPIMLTAGEFDPRVEAWHAKKMAARLQAASAGSAEDGDLAPVLLRVDAGGHGIGQSLDDLVAQRADIFAFLLAQVTAPRG